MRLRILSHPTGTIDGAALDQCQVGRVYEFGTHVASVFVAEGWGECIADADTVAVERPPTGMARIRPLLLVVDDDPSRLTESLLTAHGYHVLVAAHGRDALRTLRQQCPDLIVLDLNMPVIDGWQFRDEQRYFLDQTRAAVPVLIVTGEDDAATHAVTLRAVGCDHKTVRLR